VARYPFLSDEWIEQSKKIREKSHDHTSSGRLEMDVGHLESPDLTVTLSYDTAKAILVDADAAAAMNAFMSGRIRVDGDITKMIALQTASASASTDPTAAEVVRRIQEITE
jgi:putative sterol carrier protein